MAKKTATFQKKTVINTMGLFWHRDQCLWRGNRAVGQASLMGVRAGAKRQGHVNFWNQVGIYALYTADYRIVYVGQAGIGDKACIGSRLKAHTRDDLAGRWELFSWFGLKKVKGNNALGAKFELAHTTWRGIADILEGVVIEIAEPPMNSQKGRFGKGVHRYLQAPPLAGNKADGLATIKDLGRYFSKIEKQTQSAVTKLGKQIGVIAKKVGKKI